MLCNVYQDNKIDGCSCTGNNSESNLRISSSVASFLVWGGGGQDPQMYRQKKKIMYMSSEASERSELSSLLLLVVWRYKRQYIYRQNTNIETNL